MNQSLVQKWSDSIGAAATAAGPDWLRALRSKAALQLKAADLPDRKVEAWKYTPLRKLERLDPQLDTMESESGPAAHFPPPLSDSATVIDLSDGRMTEDRPDCANGVTLLPLSAGLEEFGDRLRPLIEGIGVSGRDRVFAALNTALLDQGLVVHVGENVVAGPVLLRWAFSGEYARFSQFRVFVLLDSGARLDLLEQFQSETATKSALNVIVQAQLGEGAGLKHVRLQHESEEAVLLTSTAVSQEAKSSYRYRGFDLGGGLVRHEFNVDLSGRGASADLGGAFVLDNQRHVDNHVSVDHAAPDCSSEQFFRGVLGGRSRGVFNGRALIRPGADGSSVRQSNANLLLSDLAEMDTKPELEIYADEVEASHGATVGQLDENAVFYLRSRGLSDSQARRMLTSAFCHAVTDRLEDREVAARVASLLDQAMPEQAR